MLRVFGRRNSLNVQKVMWFVGELGLDHNHVPAGGDAGRLDTPEFRAMNPHGKVPVIDDDGLYVWESHSILRYLAARYAMQHYWPPSPAGRARIDPWLDWVQTELQPDFLGGVFWGYYRTPEAQRDDAAVARSLSRTAAHARLLDGILKQRAFLAGDALTLADFPLGAQLFRYFTLDIERPVTPHLAAYYQTLCKRPAYREHVMLPYDDLRGRLAF
jgi:glutathione S-transferase